MVDAMLSDYEIRRDQARSCAEIKGEQRRKPLIVRSGYRSPSHNRALGGAPASKHMLGTAFDIAMSNHDPLAFVEVARAAGFLGFGTYPRSGFTHIAPRVQLGRTLRASGHAVRAGNCACP